MDDKIEALESINDSYADTMELYHKLMAQPPMPATPVASFTGAGAMAPNPGYSAPPPAQAYGMTQATPPPATQSVGNSYGENGHRLLVPLASLYRGWACRPTENPCAPLDTHPRTAGHPGPGYAMQQPVAGFAAPSGAGAGQVPQQQSVHSMQHQGHTPAPGQQQLSQQTWHAAPGQQQPMPTGGMMQVQTSTGMQASSQFM